MSQGKQEFEEQQRKLAIEQKMREKKEMEEKMARQRQLYENEMREKFGDNWKSLAPQKQAVSELKGIELAKKGIDIVTTVYTEMRAPGVA